MGLWLLLFPLAISMVFVDLRIMVLMSPWMWIINILIQGLRYMPSISSFPSPNLVWWHKRIAHWQCSQRSAFQTTTAVFQLRMPPYSSCECRCIPAANAAVFQLCVAVISAEYRCIPAARSAVFQLHLQLYCSCQCRCIPAVCRCIPVASAAVFQLGVPLYSSCDCSCIPAGRREFTSQSQVHMNGLALNTYWQQFGKSDSAS